jgi:glycosyltransferase involved in cell wall biosynthesis
LIARETAVVSDTIRGKSFGIARSFAYRRLYRRFHTVVCQSEAMRTELVRKFGVPAAKAKVIRNPIDLTRVRRLARESEVVSGFGWSQQDSNAIDLVAAGRLTEVKGFDLLIEALAVVPNSRLRLTILGEGPLRGELESLALARGLESRVRFVGFHPSPYAFFADARAFVLSSRSEAFPNVVLEALACGTPVIATPASGGVTELLEGRPGCVIVPEVTAKSLADALANYPFDQPRVAGVGSLEAFSTDRISAEYDAMFTSVCAFRASSDHPNSSSISNR